MVSCGFRWSEVGPGTVQTSRLDRESAHEVIEQLRIEKPRVRLSGLGAISGLLRKGGNRELLPNLETHLKVFGNLIEVMPKLIRGLWPIKGRVVADRAKQRFTVVEVLAILSSPSAPSGLRHTRSHTVLSFLRPPTFSVW